MRSRSLPIIVIDTCCLFDFFVDNTDDARSLRVQGVLERHEKDALVAIPSVVRLEFLGRAQKGQDGEAGHTVASRAEAYSRAREWLEAQTFLDLALDPPVIARAEDLMVPFALKGADAAVLGAAQFHEATHLFTFDNQLLKIGKSLPGLNVVEPDGPAKVELELDW